jgi:hypothetical protein
MSDKTPLGDNVYVELDRFGDCILSVGSERVFERIRMKPDTIAAFLKWLRTQPGSGAKVAEKERAE